MQALFQSRLFVYLLAALSGAALVTAFAPFDYSLVAFLSPAVLVILWLQTPPRWAFRIGFFFGLGFFGAGVSWVYHSIHVFGQAPVSFALGLTVAFVLIMSLYPALLGWLQAGCSEQTNVRSTQLIRLVLIIPAGWVLLEWLRGWLFTGFPWLQLGYSQLDTPLASLAPVAGVLGVSYVVILLAALLVVLITQGWKARLAAMVAIMAIGVSVWLVKGVHWTTPFGKPLSVALVQGSIEQQNKWERSWLLPTVERYEKLTYKHLDADLIVWPEVALPGTYRLFKDVVLAPMSAKLQQRGTDLITGILYEEPDGRLFNSVVRIGENAEFYHKRHLVPFGEYIPFRQWLTWLDRMVVIATDDIDAGTEAVPIHAAGQVIGSSICYEDAYGVEMADFLPDATLLVNVSNDAWFGKTIAADQHLQIAQMRALELGRPLLRATNTGITAIVDYQGHLQAKAPTFKTWVLTGEVTGRTGATPFAQWKNLPLLVFLSLLLLLGMVTKCRQGRTNHTGEAK